MTNEQKCNIGVIGLGVMGSSLAKNMINHGFAPHFILSQTRKESGLRAGRTITGFFGDQRNSFRAWKGREKFSYDYGR